MMAIIATYGTNSLKYDMVMWIEHALERLQLLMSTYSKLGDIWAISSAG